MIAIVNYGVGNLLSIKKAFHRLRMPAEVTFSPKEIEQAQKIVLPGVGSFGEAMKNLEGLSFSSLIRQKARNGTPLLGICLGMQVLFEESEEDEGIEGLSLIQGIVRKLPLSVKIPHLGWNQVSIKETVDLPDRKYFYFAHSYYCCPACPKVIAGETYYGITFPSLIKQGNLLGVQFHPEKSGSWGLEFLKRWGEC